MADQIVLELPFQRAMGRRRAARRDGDYGPPPDQLALDFTEPAPVRVIRIPRPLDRSTVCAKGTRVTLNGVTLAAIEWAARLSLNWDTVRQRRFRGSNWTESLQPKAARSSFNDRR